MPTFLTSTETSISIEWNAPLFDGGCPVYDYGVYRDQDGTGTSTFDNVNPSSSYIRNDPENT